MEYPFDSKFKKIIDESEIGWDFLFSRPTQFLLEYMNLELLDNLEKNGYPGETVQKHFDELRTWTTDALFERAIADDDDSPALGLLQSSDSREIFERASLSCRSTNPEERAIGVCVLMRTPGRTFHDEAGELREALVERLEDTHEECRHEAILGLAKRHDGRVKPALLKALQSKKVWRMAIDAAKELADPDFYERLIELRYGDTEDYLEEAIAACRPN